MASFMLYNSFLVILFASIAYFFTLSTCETYSSFKFGKNASFASNDIALYGDSKLLDGGSSTELSHGGGRVVYNKPIEYVHHLYQYPAGFSTAFSFSVSPNQSQSLAFVVFRANETVDNSLFQVKFDISENFTKFQDSNVTVSFSGVTKVKGNFTIANLERKESLLLYSWIVYEPSCNPLEVQLGESEDSLDHLVESWADSSLRLNDGDAFMVGVKSYSGNFSLSSWSFEQIPALEHPIVPPDFVKRSENGEAENTRRREKKWKIVTRFAMTFGFIGLVFFGVMLIWAAFKRNNLVMVMSAEGGVKTKEFKCGKMEKMEAEREQERK